MKFFPDLISAFWISLLTYSSTVSAQKIPNIQESSQQLPLTIKIDGKLNEWGNLLAAYNKATRIEYILASDDKNLYLAVRSKDKSTTAKIMAGGITLTINPAGKNNLNEAPAITFPLSNSAYYLDKSSNTVRANFKILLDSTSIRNSILTLTDLKVLKLKGVTDSVISLYNEYGIKAKLAYANQILVSELVIPLHVLGLSNMSQQAFAYNIRLNGVHQPILPGAPPPPPVTPPAGRAPGSAMFISTEISMPTSFWGRYTLQKAQVQ